MVSYLEAQQPLFPEIMDGYHPMAVSEAMTNGQRYKLYRKEAHGWDCMDSGYLRLIKGQHSWCGSISSGDGWRTSTVKDIWEIQKVYGFTTRNSTYMAIPTDKDKNYDAIIYVLAEHMNNLKE